MERPYFLMGSPSTPVYQWRWSSSSRSTAVAGLARGIDRFDPLASAGVAVRTVYDHGQWRGVLPPRPCLPRNATPRPLPPPPAPPVAVFPPDRGPCSNPHPSG